MTIFTFIPKLEVSKSDLSSSLSFFPLVGLILGALISALNWAMEDLWEPIVRGAILCTSLAFMTRGLHLDGLSDVADAIGSRADREAALKIMKDSHIGALGALALISLFLLKFVSLASLSKYMAWQYLMIAPTLSRWSLNCLSALSTYAREKEGLGSPFCGKRARPALIISSLTALCASWFLLELTGLYLLIFVLILALFSAYFFKKHFGGITGDCLGAHLELVETAVFMIGAALCR